MQHGNLDLLPFLTFIQKIHFKPKSLLKITDKWLPTTSVLYFQCSLKPSLPLGKVTNARNLIFEKVMLITRGGEGCSLDKVNGWNLISTQIDFKKKNEHAFHGQKGGITLKPTALRTEKWQHQRGVYSCMAWTTKHEAVQPQFQTSHTGLEWLVYSQRYEQFTCYTEDCNIKVWMEKIMLNAGITWNY